MLFQYIAISNQLFVELKTIALGNREQGTGNSEM